MLIYVCLYIELHSLRNQCVILLTSFGTQLCNSYNTMSNNIQLRCDVVGCTWSTPELPANLYPNMVTQLENHSRMAHAHTTPATPRAEKPRRPALHMKHGSCTEEDWTFFQHQFSHYKKLSNLTTDEPRHLQECLDVELQQLLYASVGVAINTMTEATMLKHVEKLAVRARNKLVATQKLRGKRQGHDQTVQTYVADLRSTARECDFSVTCATCKTDTSYADDMVRDQLIAGLADGELQQRIFAKCDITLEQAIVFIAGEESGKWSKQELTSESVATVSTY